MVALVPSTMERNIAWKVATKLEATSSQEASFGAEEHEEEEQKEKGKRNGRWKRRR